MLHEAGGKLKKEINLSSEHAYGTISQFPYFKITLRFRLRNNPYHAIKSPTKREEQ